MARLAPFKPAPDRRQSIMNTTRSGITAGRPLSTQFVTGPSAAAGRTGGRGRVRREAVGQTETPSAISRGDRQNNGHGRPAEIRENERETFGEQNSLPYEAERNPAGAAKENELTG